MAIASTIGAGLSLGSALYKAFNSPDGRTNLNTPPVGIPTLSRSQANTRTNRLNDLNSLDDFLRFNFRNQSTQGHSVGYLQDILGKKVINSLSGAAASALPLAFGGIGANLARQGATDPRRLSGQVSEISRGTQAAQDELEGRLARQGMQRSGLGAALSSAVSDSGNRAINTLQANEAQLQEQRYRSDIAQAINSIINPALQNQGLERGIALNVANQNASADVARNNEQLTFLSGLLGTFASNMGGGK